MVKRRRRRNREFVDGATVFLERDVSETDRFDRLLRYVWLEYGTMVNEVLVAEGYAQVSTSAPDVKYADRFLAAQTAAREAGLGLWTLAPVNTTNGRCDAAYPDVCIPPPPSDLDCGEISYTNFTVLAPDPHRFEGDCDGAGFEGKVLQATGRSFSCSMRDRLSKVHNALPYSVGLRHKNREI